MVSPGSAVTGRPLIVRVINWTISSLIHFTIDDLFI